MARSQDGTKEPRRGHGEGHIAKTKRKDGLLRGYITVGYKPDGKPIRKYAYARTKKELVAKLKDLQEQLQAGVVDTKRQTVSQYLDRWLKHVMSSGLQPRTVKDYEMRVRVHIRPALGHTPLAKLTPLHIQEFYDSKRADDEGDEDGLSAQSIKHIHRVLHTALQWAVDLRQLPFNPAGAARPGKVPRKRQPTLKVDEVIRYFEALGDERLKPLYVLAALTAARQSEAFALRWADVDFNRGTIQVEQKVQWIDGKPWYGAPKTDESRRQIPLLPELADELRKHRDRQAFERRAAKSAWQDNDLVFCQPDGRPLRPYQVHGPHFAALDKAGCRRIPFKNLRHTTASLLVALGVPLRIIAEILGHSTIRLTADTYSDVGVEIQREAMSKLSKALFGAK